jgi:enoyl-CoA hydratase/carnithine racemase
MLGLLPGAGGTQRVLRLCGLTNALDITMTGKQLAAKKAKKLGLVHQVIEPIGVNLQGAFVFTRIVQVRAQSRPMKTHTTTCTSWQWSRRVNLQPARYTVTKRNRRCNLSPTL